MGTSFAIVALIALIGLAAVLAALVQRRRSIPLAVAALFMAFVTAVGAWYAWAESHSTPWTLGYAALAILSLVAAVRQCLGSRKPPAEQAKPHEWPS